VEAESFTSHLRSLSTILREIGTQSLEDELIDVAVSVSDERKGAMFARYRGWDGKGGAVLQTVGDEFGLTRERVRQICVQVETQLATAQPRAPVLARCLALATLRAPSWSSEIQSALITAGLARGPVNIEILIDAAQLLSQPVALTTEVIDGRQRVRVSDDEGDQHLRETIMLVKRAGRRSVEHWGAGRIEDVCAIVTHEADRVIDSRLVDDVLTRDPGFRWLDQTTGWFWNAEVPRNRLLNQIEKVLSVADSISIAELRTAVARNYRMEGQAPPRRVLAELCRQHGAYVVEDDIVRAEPPLDPANILAETELSFVQVLRAHGSVMSRDALEEACRRRGMNKATFYVYIKNSPVLTCPRRGVYGLAGSLSSPGQLEALAPRRTRSRTIIDSGWAGEGRVWVVHRVSRGMLNSGVFTVPAGMRSMLLGEFILRFEHGDVAGTLRFRDYAAWGLGPFFRRANGRPGDYIALVFDLASREATARLGDRTIVSYFSEPSAVKT
jgi:hypothetical protein